MRQLTDHMLNENEPLQIHTADDADPNAGGAHHKYLISYDPANNGYIRTHAIEFQHGPVKEHGLNGVTEAALITILLDRYRSFQKSQWSCRENALTITALEEALLWQQKRTLDRMRRGTEGTNKV